MGPPTILTSAEENMLVHWAIEMAAIGYGRTREQLCLTVKEMLDKDGRANPFRQNMHGEDWWYALLKRHPEISQKLQRFCRSHVHTAVHLPRLRSGSVILRVLLF